MLLPLVALLVGLALLLWSAGQFVTGATMMAKRLKISPLLIGMIIVGYGTSAPELMVSALASFRGSPEIAIGNVYGSNIGNIAFILGLTALLRPINVHSQIIQREIPILLGVTFLAGFLALDGTLSRVESLGLLVVFAMLVAWTIYQGKKQADDTFAGDVQGELEARGEVTAAKAIIMAVVGLSVLVGSSRLLVWSASSLARSFGVSDLIIGLTIVALGTSLPELASSLMAARKGENDLVLGNIIGSNLFNTLAVSGLAGMIHPLSISGEILKRDLSMMTAATIFLFVFCYGFKGPGRINRWEGLVLLTGYVVYTVVLVTS